MLSLEQAQTSLVELLGMKPEVVQPHQGYTGEPSNGQNGWESPGLTASSSRTAGSTTWGMPWAV